MSIKDFLDFITVLGGPGTSIALAVWVYFGVLKPLQDDVAELKADIKTIKTALYGNGRPPKFLRMDVAEEMTRRSDELHNQFDERISRLENKALGV